jgi:hypothetical protein
MGLRILCMVVTGKVKDGSRSISLWDRIVLKKTFWGGDWRVRAWDGSGCLALR